MVLVLREIMTSAVGVIVLVTIMQTLQVVVVLKDVATGSEIGVAVIVAVVRVFVIAV